MSSINTMKQKQEDEFFKDPVLDDIRVPRTEGVIRRIYCPSHGGVRSKGNIDRDEVNNE